MSSASIAMIGGSRRFSSGHASSVGAVFIAACPERCDATSRARCSSAVGIARIQRARSDLPLLSARARASAWSAARQGTGCSRYRSLDIARKSAVDRTPIAWQAIGQGVPQRDQRRLAFLTSRLTLALALPGQFGLRSAAHSRPLRMRARASAALRGGSDASNRVRFCASRCATSRSTCSQTSSLYVAPAGFGGKRSGSRA